MTMLYIKYTSFVSCCCREDFFIYFHYKSMVDNDMPGTWPVWTPGAPLAAFIKERIIHWSTQHMKALGHMVSEKKKNHYTLQHTKYEGSVPCGFGEEDFFMFCPITPTGWGLYGPQGHGWQDL